MLTSLLTLVMALQSAQVMRPFLGLTTEVYDTPITVGEQTFPGGLRITWVTPDSGAAQAGLQPGDILVAFPGVDFTRPAAELPDQFVAAIGTHAPGDRVALTVVRSQVTTHAMIDGQPAETPDVWQDPRGFIAQQPLGTRVELSAAREASVLTAEVTLGIRPSQNPVTVPFPATAELLPMPPAPLAEEALATRLLAQYGATAEYAALRARLAKLVDQGDPFRKRRVVYALREPFTAANLAREIGAVPATPIAALTHAARCLDLELPSTDATPLQIGLTAEAHAAQLEELLRRAHAHYAAAFAGLTAEERTLLDTHFADVTDAFREVVMVLSDPDVERQMRVRAFVAAAQKVNVAELVAAGRELARATEADYLAGLQHDLADVSAGIVTRRDTEWGPIVIAGRASQWHQDPAAVLIDLGGDEHYTAPTLRPLALLIDCGGADVYQATDDGAQGGVVSGIAVLCDLAGDDTYIGQEWTQGAAALGVGVLWDCAGDDVYRAQDYSQAAAFCGVGLLLDDAGDDRYEAPRYAQSIAMPGGYSALVDRAGNDRYYIGGRDITNYGTTGVFDAFGQGCGIGFRGLASGGLAVLRDVDGDDDYCGANFAQGGGYYFGWGLLFDDAGDDRYRGARYAQAWAAHQALGHLEDASGDDVYDAWRGVGQSCSWDETVTVLLDHAGDDFYSGGGFALCPAHNNGWALLIDYAGRDRYAYFQGVPRADGSDQVTSFALQLDFGGAADAYPKDGCNNVVRHGNRHGFFGDFPGGADAALEALPQLMQDTP